MSAGTKLLLAGCVGVLLVGGCVIVASLLMNPERTSQIGGFKQSTPASPETQARSSTGTAPEPNTNSGPAAAGPTVMYRGKAGKETYEIHSDATVRLCARALYLIYNSNEVSADNLFKGKTVEVKGRVDRVGKDILNSICLTLETERYSIFGVQCFFNDERAEEVAKLHPKQPVVVRGRCDGKFGNVLLKECVLR